MIRLAAVLLVLSAQAGLAEGVTASPRPVPNPRSAAVTQGVFAPSHSLRPVHRADQPVGIPPVAQSSAAPETTAKPGRKGSVCGNPAIKGEKLAAIKGKVKGCGIDAPVRVTQIAGLHLSPAATLSCDAAQALHDWIKGAMRPAFAPREVVELQVAASYACRPRNNKKGARVSEHGRGKAIDIAGFTFADGTHWTIVHDYNRQIRKAHRAACGIFGTTLGPGSDGYHEDHLHFDTARYRGATYCH